MSTLCKLFGHRKPFRIMGPMVCEALGGGAWKGHNATVGCFYCGWRRRMGGVWIGPDHAGVVQ